MPGPPDITAARLTRFIATVARRVRVASAIDAVSLGSAVALGAALAAAATRREAGIAWAVVLGAAVALWRWLALRPTTSPSAVALLAERRLPALRNQLVTALELRDHPDRASARVRARVDAHAATVVEGAVIDDIVPARPTVTRSVVAIAAMLLLVIVGGLSRRRARPAERAVVPAARAGADARTGILGVEAIVTPPPYVEAGPQQVTDPSRIDALAGSTVTLRIATTAAAAAISYAGTTHTPAIQGQAATVALRLDASGGLGIDARDRAGTVVDRRLIPIVVRPDAPPQVSIEEPGKDLVLASAADPVRFAVRASDDLALASLTLHYTRVTGSGEQYEFDEGRLAMAVSRERRDRWLGAAAPRLAGLGLQPGDLLVVYAQAADRRPGAAAVVSDSYVIEIGKAQAAISGGFAVPTEEDRAAISLSALIQKTERLHATRAQLGASVLAEQSAALAVEQRMVRTETLFLMGAHGEVEDEEAEAEHSNEIQEGRLENRGQADLRTATRLMSAAERSLLLTDTGGALPPQRAALAAMQRALSKQRYFLRTLPVRSRIDPTRRLSGDLSEASGWARRGDRPPPDRSLTAIRAALADLDRLHRIDRLDASAATDLAARVLALDPASAALQHAASGLMALSKGGADPVRRREALTVVAVALEGLAAAVPAAPSASPELTASPLRGALADAWRQSRGRP